MTVPFRTEQEIKGNNDFGQQFSDQIYNATLAAAANTTLTVPGGGVMGGLSSQVSGTSKNKVMAVIRVSEGDEVWVAVNRTAAVPVGAAFALASSEVVIGSCPMARYLKVGDVLHFFTAGATTSVSVAFYALPS